MSNQKRSCSFRLLVWEFRSQCKYHSWLLKTNAIQFNHRLSQGSTKLPNANASIRTLYTHTHTHTHRQVERTIFIYKREEHVDYQIIHELSKPQGTPLDTRSIHHPLSHLSLSPSQDLAVEHNKNDLLLILVIDWS